MPFTAKDNLETRGVVTAIGVPERAGTVPPADATAVARLRAAGGILLGKTNCPAWGGGLETDNPLDGRTDNPYDRARTPGGSSGGEAAVAAALSPCGLGTDSGGSLRVPAHLCGVATLKPTNGLVPVTGVLDDDGPIGALSDPRTQPGPIARSVQDLPLLLGVLAGSTAARRGRPGAPGRPGRRPGRGPAGGGPHRRRVARTDPGDHRHRDRGRRGPRQRRGGRRGGSAIRDGHALTVEVCVLRRPRGEQPGALPPTAPLGPLPGRAGRLDDQLGRDPHPGLRLPGPTHGATETPELRDAIRWTTPWSLTGWPCAVVRCGTSPDGLPIGVQVVAPPWRDDLALALAAHLETTLGGWHPPPL